MWICQKKYWKFTGGFQSRNNQCWYLLFIQIVLPSKNLYIFILHISPIFVFVFVWFIFEDVFNVRMLNNSLCILRIFLKLCRPSEARQWYCAIPGGSPLWTDRLCCCVCRNRIQTWYCCNKAKCATTVPPRHYHGAILLCIFYNKKYNNIGITKTISAFVIDRLQMLFAIQFIYRKTILRDLALPYSSCYCPFKQVLTCWNVIRFYRHILQHYSGPLCYPFPPPASIAGGYRNITRVSWGVVQGMCGEGVCAIYTCQFKG